MKSGMSRSKSVGSLPKSVRDDLIVKKAVEAILTGRTGGKSDTGSNACGKK